MKILLIEDDQLIANIYKNKFALEGFTVEVAFDGEVGLEMVKAFRPDAVVLDLMLPKLSGLDLIKQVRAMPEFAKTPLLVFSNTYLSNLVQEAWKAGATKCLSKTNCTPRHVLDAVRSSLGITEQPSAAGGTGATTQAQTATAVPKPSVVAPATAAESSMQADDEFQAELRQEFLLGFPANLSAMRGVLKSLGKAVSDADRVKPLQDLYQYVHTMTGNAAIAGMVHIAQMGDALEVLIKELEEKPKNLNASTLRTVATGVDFLGFLFEHGTKPNKQELPPPQILVVDDEVISRRAVTYALEKAKLKSVACEDPNAALEMLSETQFDLVFLDVDMPGMNGFELCTRLRALPQHKKTPVVFVTSLNDFENRANSSMSGGNDFIGKPFLFIELAVKALIHLQRGRLMPGR